MKKVHISWYKAFRYWFYVKKTLYSEKNTVLWRNISYFNGTIERRVRFVNTTYKILMCEIIYWVSSILFDYSGGTCIGPY